MIDPTALLTAAESEEHKTEATNGKGGRGFMDSLFPAYLALYRKNWKQEQIYEWLGKHTDKLPAFPKFQVAMSVRYTKNHNSEIARASKHH